MANWSVRAKKINSKQYHNGSDGEAILKEKGSSFPSGWNRSGQYCVKGND